MVGYLLILVVLPLAALVTRGLARGTEAFVAAVTAPSAVAALSLSVGTAGLATLINAVAGTAIAWVLVRFDVPGRRALAALVDLPVAIPTLVAGMVIVNLLGPTTLVGAHATALGVPIVFARPGIVLALLFVTLPLVVRAVGPVLEASDRSEDEAAHLLGASRWTTFWRVQLPPLLPAIGAGSAQTFARAVAEFGSIVVVSGNMPGRTLVASVWMLGEVEGGATDDAAAVSVVLLGLALVLHLAAANLARRAGGSRG